MSSITDTPVLKKHKKHKKDKDKARGEKSDGKIHRANVDAITFVDFL